VNVVANDEYSAGDADASVTELLGPPRKAVLEEQHADELEEDASDRIWSLFGQSLHSVLERANETGVAERRLSVDCEGWKVSGGMDLVCKDDILSDYKRLGATRPIRRPAFWSCPSECGPQTRRGSSCARA
jgi:hypothetical protein